MPSKYFFLLKVICCLFFIIQPLSASKEKSEACVFLSHAIIKDFKSSFDWKIPEKMFKQCQAIGIFPRVRKAGLVAGFNYGQGIILKKNAGNFGPPAFFKLKGISLGLQLGVQEADLLMFFMTDDVIDELKQGKSNNLDFSISTAAGPAGREWLKSRKSRIYAYSHAKGIFAGINLSGISLKYNYEYSKSYYNDAYNSAMIFEGSEVESVPDSANDLILTLINLNNEEE